MDVLNLDELLFTHFNNYKSLPLSSFMPKSSKTAFNIAPETIYKHIILNASESDSSTVNINKYGKLGYKIEPVSAIFCDNILLCVHVPEEKTEEIKGFRKLKGDLLKVLRSYIITWFNKNNLTNIKDSDITAKRIINFSNSNNKFLKELEAEELKEIYNSYRLEFNPATAKTYGQVFKIELSDLKYKDVVSLFSLDNTEDLRKDFIKVADVDFTRDYKGSMDKELLKEYLLSLGFRESTQQNILDLDEDSTEPDKDNKEKIINVKEEIKKIVKEDKAIYDNFNNNKVIIKNNNTVGANCLTFLKDNNRYKVYNKFLHSIEIKNNVQQTGTNIYNWCNNKEKRLRENIPLTLKNGFLRLEITFYLQDNELPSEREILKELNYLESLLIPDIIYNTPISQQWRAYAECIKNNVLLIDRTNNNLLLCYSINKQTKRITGLCTKSRDKNEEKTLKEVNKIDFLYILTNCTFNTEIKLIILDIEDTKSEENIITPSINISYKNLLIRNKDNTARDTYLFKPNNIYYSLDKCTAGTKNAPSDMGLIDLDNIKLRITEKYKGRQYYDTKKYKFNDNFICFTLETPEITFIKPKQQEEQQQDILFLQNNKNKLDEIKEDRENKIKQLLINNQIKEHRENIINNIYKCTLQGTKNLNTLQEGAELKIKALKQFTKTILKESKINGATFYTGLPELEKRYILITVKDNVYNSYWAPPHINNYINKLLDNKALTLDNRKLIYLDNTENIIFKFKILSFSKTNNKGTLTNISKLIINPLLKKYIQEKEENNININSLALENYKISPTIREKDCKKLESLNEGEIINITAFMEKETGSKVKYLFKIEGREDETYISNIFLEDLIKEKGEPDNKFKLLIGRIKTTRTKAKLRTVIFN